MVFFAPNCHAQLGLVMGTRLTLYCALRIFHHYRRQILSLLNVDVVGCLSTHSLQDY